MDLKQRTPEDILKNAYQLQEALKRERGQLKLHEEEYKKLLAMIATIRRSVRVLMKRSNRSKGDDT